MEYLYYIGSNTFSMPGTIHLFYAFTMHSKILIHQCYDLKM